MRQWDLNVVDIRTDGMNSTNGRYDTGGYERVANLERDT